MRDQWRASDEHKDDIHHGERGRRDRRQRSPAASDHRREADGGLKIKGIADPTPGVQSSRKSEARRETGGVRANRRSSQSPQKQDRAEEPTKRSGRSSVERPRDRKESHHQRYQEEFISRRRRSRSRSPLGSTRLKEQRRRTRSPVYSTHTDRGVSSKRRERAHSPPRSPRVVHYSSARDDTSASRTAPDSYVPTTRRRRSRTPPRDEYRPAPPRRRSLSPAKRHKPRERSPAPLRKRSPRRQVRQDPHPDSRQPTPRSRQPSGDRRNTSYSKRKSDLLPTREETRQASKRHKRSHSPYDRDRSRVSGRRMQSSGRPIQSILDDDSRPPSPPRRIPSFDTEYHGVASGVNSYPIQDTSRRPPHIDTRQGYTPSPQWTPVASHHGSPHSASPYGQSRGGWGGQTPQYQGQPGYVLQPVSICSQG